MNGAIDTIYGYPSQMRVSRNSNEIGLPKNLGRGSCVKTVQKSLKSGQQFQGRPKLGSFWRENFDAEHDIEFSLASLVFYIILYRKNTHLVDISWPCYCAVLLSKYTKDIVLQDSLPETINPEPLEVTKNN